MCQNLGDFKHASCIYVGMAYFACMAWTSAGEGKMLEGMTTLSRAAAAEDPEGVMSDTDEEDLDAVD